MGSDANQTSPGGAASRINPLGERAAFPVLVLILLASFVLIWANFNQPFYRLDDATHLKDATENSIADLFDISRQETLLPVSFLSLRWDRWFFGPPFSETLFVQQGHNSMPLQDDFLERNVGWATATRIINAIYHALAAWLLWYFLKRIGASPGTALTVALAWTVHPMACESVCWISERKNVLAALFGFGSLYAWAAWRDSKWRWPAISALFVLAVLSKPTAVGFLPIYFALQILDPLRSESPARAAKEWARSLAPLILPAAITLAIVIVNFQIHSIYFVEYPGGSKWTALLTDLEIFARYAGNVLFPADLSFFYGVKPIVSLADWRVWYYAALILSGCAFCIWAPAGAPSRRRSLLGIVWFFAALGPTSNLAPIPFWMQDRYAYVSAAGLLLAAVEAARGVAIRLRGARFAPVLSAGFLSLLTVMTVLRSMVYVDTETLYKDAAERQPLSGMAQSCMFNIHLYNARHAKNVQTLREECSLVYYYLQRSAQCTDLTNFRDAFEMRVSAAQALLLMGDFKEALQTLDGWLPPAHLKPAPPTAEHTFEAMDLKRFYKPESMALAHTLAAEAMMQYADFDPPTGGPSLSERLKKCDAALAFLNPPPGVIGQIPPTAAFDWLGTRTLLQARILLVRARLKKESNDENASQADTNEAKELLRTILSRASVGAKAKSLLDATK